jgi:hypothetical protein
MRHTWYRAGLIVLSALFITAWWVKLVNAEINRICRGVNPGCMVAECLRPCTYEEASCCYFVPVPYLFCVPHDSGKCEDDIDAVCAKYFVFIGGDCVDNQCRGTLVGQKDILTYGCRFE